MSTESMVTQAALEKLTEWRRGEVQAIGAAISTRNWHNLEAAYNALRDKMDRVIHAPPATRHQPRREAVLAGVVAAKQKMQHCRDELNVAIETLVDAHVALTTPAPAAESDWFAGDVDCDGNELVTIRADELQKLRDEREKFMWQVRDTCTRAEKAEAALAAAPAVSTDEIVAVLEHAKRAFNTIGLIEGLDPIARSAEQDVIAILSRIRGEGE